MDPVIFLIVLIVGASILGVVLQAYQTYEQKELKRIEYKIESFENGWEVLEPNRIRHFESMVHRNGLHINNPKYFEFPQNISFKEFPSFSIYVFENGFLIDFDGASFPSIQALTDRFLDGGNSTRQVDPNKIPKSLRLKKYIHALPEAHEAVVEFINNSNEFQKLIRNPTIHSILTKRSFLAGFFQLGREIPFSRNANQATSLAQGIVEELNDTDHIKSLKNQI